MFRFGEGWFVGLAVGHALACDLACVRELAVLEVEDMEKSIHVLDRRKFDINLGYLTDIPVCCVTASLIVTSHSSLSFLCRKKRCV